jgi:hypothetical protein
MKIMMAREDIEPWYKQFWPWFIIALPASVVVASIITVTIAVKNQDSLVADDYYKEGLGINQALEKDDHAKQMQLSAEVTIDELVGEIKLALFGDVTQWPQSIEIYWVHPTDRRQDFKLITNRIQGDQLNVAQRYIGQLDVAISGRWYVQLSASEPEPWRLKTAVNIADFNAVKETTFLLGVASEGH